MCVKPITIKNRYRSQTYDKHLITIPCGKCVLCINKKRQQWAFRLTEEAKSHTTNYLVTLTYNDINLPFLNHTTGQYPTRLANNPDQLRETDQIEKIVYKKDVQLFIKRLRKQQHKKYKSKLRYYATSEYGTKKTRRPHYHIILFNLEPEIAHEIKLNQIWKYGNSDIKPLENNPSIYYYLTKYLFKQRELKNTWNFKPFALMSVKPYIGHQYITRNKQYHLKKQDLFTTFNEKEIIIPKIYHQYFPDYIKKNTFRKLKDKLTENEQQTFKNTHKENHHPDILEIVKKVRKQDKYNKELSIYKQQLQ